MMIRLLQRSGFERARKAPGYNVINHLSAMTKTIIGTLIIITLTHARAVADGNAEVRRNSVISWEKGYVSATAVSTMDVSAKGRPLDSYHGGRTSLNRARMDAYRSAREAALERLVTAVRSLRIDAGTTVGDAIEDHGITRGKLAETLLHSVKVREHPSGFYSSSAEVKVSFGDIIAALPYGFPEREFPKRDDAKIRTDYTGLVIDGRGLSIVPMLFPSIFNEDGLEIYGRAQVSGRYAAGTGMVAYCRNEDEAMKHRKAGRRPFYTVALRSLNGCPVISDRDARRLLSSPATTEQLKKCGVIIILNVKDSRS